MARTLKNFACFNSAITLQYCKTLTSAHIFKRFPCKKRQTSRKYIRVLTRISKILTTIATLAQNTNQNTTSFRLNGGTKNDETLNRKSLSERVDNFSKSCP